MSANRETITGPVVPKPWSVYILECSDHSFYVGISDNVERRVASHNSGKGPAYTRRRRPVRLVFQEDHPDKFAAREREIEIKGWRRDKKLALIVSAADEK
jgi:putative endonuclease